MKVKFPSQGELENTAKEIDWTVIGPTGDSDEEDYTSDELQYLEQMIDFGHGNRRKVLIKVGLADDNETVDHMQIHLSALWKVLFEHQLYSAAEGFSDTELEVVRTMEGIRAQRVHVGEINDNLDIDVSESSLYKALKNLQDKGLVKKLEGRGYYQYCGPTV